MAKTTQKEIADALNLTQGRITQLKGQGMPVTSLTAAKRWYQNRGLKRAATHGNSSGEDVEEERGRGRPMKLKEPSNTGDPIQDALNDAIEVTNLAYREYQDACAKKLSTRGMRLSEFNKATQNRIMMEKLCREEAERRGLLIEKSLIVERCRRILNPVVNALRKLPSEQGPQCNRERPLEAVGTLQRAVDGILKLAAAAEKGLNES